MTAKIPHPRARAEEPSQRPRPHAQQPSQPPRPHAEEPARSRAGVSKHEGALKNRRMKVSSSFETRPSGAPQDEET